MGTTIHGITYPDPSGVPSRSTLVAMANSVETAVFADAGWISLTLATGTGSVKYRAARGVVEVRVNLSAVSVASGATATIVAAGGIPAVSRPSAGVYSAAFSFDSVGFLEINTDGSVIMHASTGSFISASGQAVYLAEAGA